MVTRRDASLWREGKLFCNAPTSDHSVIDKRARKVEKKKLFLNEPPPRRQCAFCENTQRNATLRLVVLLPRGFLFSKLRVPKGAYSTEHEKLEQGLCTCWWCLIADVLGNGTIFFVASSVERRNYLRFPRVFERLSFARESLIVLGLRWRDAENFPLKRKVWNGFESEQQKSYQRPDGDV